MRTEVVLTAEIAGSGAGAEIAVVVEAAGCGERLALHGLTAVAEASLVVVFSMAVHPAHHRIAIHHVHPSFLCFGT